MLAESPHPEEERRRTKPPSPDRTNLPSKVVIHEAPVRCLSRECRKETRRSEQCSDQGSLGSKEGSFCFAAALQYWGSFVGGKDLDLSAQTP